MSKIILPGLIDEVYQKQVVKFFNQWVKKYFDINFIAVSIKLPNDQIIALSSFSYLTRFTYEKRTYTYDQPINNALYENYAFYPWRLPNATKKQNELHEIREKIFNLNAGTNFVRTINTLQGIFTIFYCVATHNKDPFMRHTLAFNANSILEIGDFCYNTLLPLFQEHAGNYHLPSIKNFNPLNSDQIIKSLQNYAKIK